MNSTGRDLSGIAPTLYGARAAHASLVNRKRFRRMRREMGISAIYCKPRTIILNKSNRINPYLLRDLAITRFEQARATAIRPLARSGFWSAWHFGEDGLYLTQMHTLFEDVLH